MERPQDLNTKQALYDKNRERFFILVIILFHVVGMLGFNLSSVDVWFLRFVPWHLLLMTGIIIANHQRRDYQFLLFAIFIFTAGFAAELLGVHTALLFGHYSYGETLGIKLYGVPLVIGVNWFLLIYIAGVLMERSPVKNIYLRALCGAAILTTLDFLIEPVAIHFDYWHWGDNTVPLKNYLCWFLLSAIMLFVFNGLKPGRQNRVPVVLLLMQFIFFAVLGLTN